MARSCAISSTHSLRQARVSRLHCVPPMAPYTRRSPCVLFCHARSRRPLADTGKRPRRIDHGVGHVCGEDLVRWDVLFAPAFLRVMAAAAGNGSRRLQIPTSAGGRLGSEMRTERVCLRMWTPGFTFPPCARHAHDGDSAQARLAWLGARSSVEFPCRSGKSRAQSIAGWISHVGIRAVLGIVVALSAA